MVNNWLTRPSRVDLACLIWAGEVVDLLRDDPTGWMAATPKFDLPDDTGIEGDASSPGALETIVLRRRGRSGAEALILIEIAPDLLGAFVVTWSTASTVRSARSVGIPCASLDDAMVESGARIHRALLSGYRLQRETAFSSQL
jgi:hypothetical protein